MKSDFTEYFFRATNDADDRTIVFFFFTVFHGCRQVVFVFLVAGINIHIFG